MMSDTGTDKRAFKIVGRWKSDTVCEGYIVESVNSKFQAIYQNQKIFLLLRVQALYRKL
jgi:hypothetical protein